MQKQTSIYIPKPCHEDWNKMTRTQQGKFCESCSKQVIDFSLMSDNQILNFLSHQSGKLCGRFDAEQLQRPLVETKIKKKKSWWMALTMPLLFLFDRSHAQGTVAIIKPDTTVSPTFKQLDIMGKLSYQPLQQITVKGKVVDEKDNPIGFADIIQKGTKHGVMSDSSGSFSIDINSNDSLITLITSCMGFKAIEKQIDIKEGNQFVTLQIQPLVAELQDIIVTSYPVQGGIQLGGAVVVGYRITTVEKLDSSFKKLIGISNVYPNPAPRESLIHLKIKNTGNYQMQLLNNQSRLIQTEEIIADAKNSTTQIHLQPNIAAGMYYLRLINGQTKKSYTEKLIIQ
jgi:hypothetical protein